MENKCLSLVSARVPKELIERIDSVILNYRNILDMPVYTTRSKFIYSAIEKYLKELEELI